MYPAAASRFYNFVRILASVVKFLGNSSQIGVAGDHNCLVREEASVDNFGYFDEEFCFLDKDLFGYLVMDLVS